MPRSKKIQLFYSGSPELFIDHWNTIISNLITYGDTIWLRAGTRFTLGAEDKHQDHYNRILQELNEAGLIQFWDLEMSRINYPEAKRIITQEEHRNISNDIDYDSISKKTIPITNYDPNEIERTSKIIEYRHELWNLKIAECCDSNQIVYIKKGLNPNQDASYFKYDTIDKRITRKIFEKFSLTNIQNLDTNDILALHKINKNYQNKINTLYNDNLLLTTSSDESVSQKINDLFEDYNNYITEELRKKSKPPFHLTAEEILIAITSLHFHLAHAIPIILPWVSFAKNQSRGFIFYMNELNRLQHKEKR